MRFRPENDPTHRTWRTCAVFLLSFFLLPNALALESLAEQHFGVEHGINSRGVTDLAWSEDGQLWLSTYDGLLRFDGQRFERFSRRQYPELPSNRVLELHRTPDGDLWLVTETWDVRRWNGAGFDLPLAPGALSPERLRRSHQYADGEWMIASANGVYRERDHRLERVCSLPEGVELLNFVRSDGGTDTPFAAWISTHAHGLWHCENDATQRVAAPELAQLPPIETLTHAPGGWLVLATHRRLWRWQAGHLEEIAFPDDANRNLFDAPLLAQEADGDALYSTNDGLFRIEGARAVRFLPEAKVKSLHFNQVERDAAGHEWRFSGSELFRDGQLAWRSESVITRIRLDREGGIFVSTRDQGLLRLAPSALHRIGKKGGLAFPNTSAITPARDGGFWAAGLHGGEHYRVRFSASGKPQVESSASPSAVWSLLETHDGQLWSGGEWLCVVRGDGADTSCDDSSAPAELRNVPGPRRDIRLLFEDSRKRLWVGSRLGLFVREQDAWHSVPDAPANTLRVALELPDGTLLFGSNGAGLWRHDGERLQRVGNAPSQLIRSLQQTRDGWLWIGTEDLGLTRARLGEDGNLHELLQLDASQGLPDDVIHQILPDASGKLWINSNRGIFRLDPARLSGDGGTPLPVLALDARDGLLEPEGNGGFHAAGFVDADGKLWFPGQGGVTGIDPAKFVEPIPPLPPTIVLTAQDGHALVDGECIAAHAPRSLAALIRTPRFSHPERLRYRWRIVGLDDEWSEPSPQRELSFSRLPPGDYRFEAQVADAGGPWLAAQSPLRFRIEPTFVESHGFAWLLAAIAALLGTALWFWRNAALRQRAAQLERIVEERTAELRKTLSIVERQKGELSALDEAKSRFFTDLSHELRTPLTLIAGPAEQALSQPDSNARAALSTIGANARRLLDLVNQILELARLEAGVYAFHPQPGDLVVTVSDTLALFDAQARKAHVGLRLRSPMQIAPATFDQDSLKKIVSNLVGNALRHSPSNTTVTVTLDLRSDGVRLYVSDQGPGIPLAQREQVFARYYSVGRAAGSGIGLAHARELARAQGGDLDVTDADGGGSCFRCVLPIAIASVNPHSSGLARDELRLDVGSSSDASDFVPSVSIDTATPTSASSDRPKLLIVEDQEDVREFIAQCLKQDFELLLAGDGVQGLALARQALPDIIVSDVMMPLMDGIEFVRLLQDMPETFGIPTILLSARGSEETQLQGLQAGAVEYLTKPFSPALLRARVQRLLGFRLRLREQLRTELTAQTAIAPSPATRTSVTPKPLSDRILEAIEANLCEPGFGVDELAQALNLSRSSLKRAMQEAGLPSPAAMIRERRMQQAAQLLEQGRGNIGEIAYAVGYASQSHFTSNFRERFGLTPREFLARS